MISQGKFSGRVIARGMDTLGSFTWMAIRGKKDTGLIFVTTYRVCQKAGTRSGPDTAFTRMCVQMREEGYKNPDPKNHVLKNMSLILEEWMGKGFHPMVMIDSNSDINESKLREFNDLHGLSDLITAGRDLTAAPPTYARGKQRINFILGDEHIKRAIVHSGSLELHDGLKASDHTMQFLDLDQKLLFRDDSFTPMPGYHREFRLYDIKRKTQFLKHLHRKHTNANV